MPDPDRLTALETELAQQRTLLVAVRGIVERLSMQHSAMQHTLTRHGEQLASLQQTLDAIKDLLDRANGR
jgi:hypothetical protein